MSRGRGNNPQFATNLGGGGGRVASISMSNQKLNLGGFNRIIFINVINNYVLSFNSFLNKVRDEMNGF